MPPLSDIDDNSAEDTVAGIRAAQVCHVLAVVLECYPMVFPLSHTLYSCLMVVRVLTPPCGNLRLHGFSFSGIACGMSNGRAVVMTWGMLSSIPSCPTRLAHMSIVGMCLFLPLVGWECSCPISYTGYNIKQLEDRSGNSHCLRSLQQRCI